MSGKIHPSSKYQVSGSESRPNSRGMSRANSFSEPIEGSRKRSKSSRAKSPRSKGRLSDTNIKTVYSTTKTTPRKEEDEFSSDFPAITRQRSGIDSSLVMLSRAKSSKSFKRQESFKRKKGVTFRNPIVDERQETPVLARSNSVFTDGDSEMEQNNTPVVGIRRYGKKKKFWKKLCRITLCCYCY